MMRTASSRFVRLAAIICLSPAFAVRALAAAEGEAGLPQLDPGIFLPQLVWLAIAFVALYFLMARLALPRIARVLDEREQRIADDLGRAERLKSEADTLLAAYRRTLADARAGAQSALRETAAAMAAETAKRETAVAASLAERTREAERQIAAAKASALTEMRTVAVDIAAALAAKVAGTTAGADRVQAAVDAVLRGSAVERS